MRSILVVDDEAHVRRVMRLALERAGYEVVIASDGEEALEWIDQQSFDVMITDICMPRCDGRALCQGIRDAGQAKQTLFVIMTSRTEDEHRQWVRELGNAELFEKPLSLSRLVAWLGETLSERQASRESS